MAYSIDFQDNTSEVLNALNISKERALYAMGLKAVEGATESITGNYETISAVDTGRLRASISFITQNHESGQMQAQIPKATGSNTIANNPVQREDVLHGSAPKDTVIVGSNVEYASYVHNGTSKMQPRPFLREGIDKTRSEMERQVEKIMKGEL